MYKERLRRNFKKVIEAHGVTIHSNNNFLESITARHVHNIVNGSSTPNIAMLEAIADEIGADMLDFFKE